MYTALESRNGSFRRNLRYTNVTKNVKKFNRNWSFALWNPLTIFSMENNKFKLHLKRPTQSILDEIICFL